MPGNQVTSSTSSTNTHSSSSSSEVAVVSASRNLSAPASLQSISPAFFKGVATLAVENIMRFLPVVDKGYRGFFRAFATTNDVEYEAVRQGVLNGMQAQFLHDVADAEMKSAEAILKLAMVNPTILKKLLTTSKNIIQKNGLPVTGATLEIALKCWDCSSCKGGRDEMAEMLMSYMRLLPNGESLIESYFNKLFPKGMESHQKAQEARATEFAESILEPLATTLKNATDDEIKLVIELTKKDGSQFDQYINTTLATNKLWQLLMLHHEAIKDYMTKDSVYNPIYLQKAFEIFRRKYIQENWEGDDRLALLTIHGAGGVQACSPTIVGMLFARGEIENFYDLDASKRKQFKVDRNCAFKYGGGDVFARSGGGVLLVSNKFWAWVCSMRGVGNVDETAVILAGCADSLESMVKQKRGTWGPASEVLSQRQPTNNESVCNAIAPR